MTNQRREMQVEAPHHQTKIKKQETTIRAHILKPNTSNQQQQQQQQQQQDLSKKNNKKKKPHRGGRWVGMEEAVPGVQIYASPASWRSDPAASTVGGSGEGGVGGVGDRESGGGAGGGGGVGGGQLARAEAEARLEASPAEAAKASCQRCEHLV
ncbi:hypothetical protein OsJ_27015 [Oryza sativa Japonica Group]|uniref:Uncharacterized protein n=1 Tax=Oryza sativa subsp. japonica TaxID=39947 RepID=A3BSA2_ORYSJ|nr:hypothetical protein OsJ_27015 [Oryza sativa Japonica Group]